MVKETHLFFDEVLKNDLSLTNFVASDFTMLNGRLAKHYGIPDVKGMEFRKVQLPKDSHRGGVLTMASVLKVTANGTTTSPVLRGAWVLDRILGTPPPKPTVDVEAVEPDIRGATTIREQLAKHRQRRSVRVAMPRSTRRDSRWRASTSSAAGGELPKRRQGRQGGSEWPHDAVSKGPGSGFGGCAAGWPKVSEYRRVQTTAA